jgi:hypothetical protein
LRIKIFAVNIFAVGKSPFCAFFNLGTGTFSNRKYYYRKYFYPQFFFFFFIWAMTVNIFLPSGQAQRDRTSLKKKKRRIFSLKKLSLEVNFPAHVGLSILKTTRRPCCNFIFFYFTQSRALYNLN